MLQQDLLLAVPETVRYERIALSDSENAFTSWERAIAAYREPTFPLDWLERLDRNPDDDWPPPLEPAERDTLLAWVASNQEAIELLDEGAERGQFQWPLIATHWSERDDVLYPGLQLRHLARLRFSTRARLASDEGDSQRAANEIEKGLQMLSLMARGEGNWTEVLLVTRSIRDALECLRLLANRFDLPAETRHRLIARLQEFPSFNQRMQLAVRVELCNERLSDLNRLPDDGSIAELVDALLEYYYYPLKLLDVTTEMCDQPLLDREIATRRLDQRRRQLLQLLGDHPHPFDKLATAKLMGEHVANALQEMTSETPPKPMWFSLQQLNASHFPKHLLRSWPEMLTPNFPLETFGDDLAATQARAPLRSGRLSLFQRWLLSRKYPSLTDKRIKRYTQRLRALDNPVGKMIAQRTTSPNALRVSAAECTASVAQAIEGLNGA